MSELILSNTTNVNYIKPANEKMTAITSKTINFVDEDYDVDFTTENAENQNGQLNFNEEELKIKRTSINLLRKIWNENKNNELKLLENVDLSSVVASSPQPSEELKNFPFEKSHILVVNESRPMPTRLIALSPDYILEFPPSPTDAVINPLSYSEDNLVSNKHRPKFGDIIKICLLNHPPQQQNHLQHGTNKTPVPATKKRNIKNRSMSESYCDVIKDVAEQLNDLKLTSSNCERVAGVNDACEGGNDKTDEGFKKQKLRKSRSLSESCNDDDPANSQCKIRKYKGILKHTVYSCDSIIMETSEEEVSMSADWTDKMRSDDEHSAGEAKKCVRFSDVIKKQLFRVNSSILGQKKKNHKKSLQRKRAQDRRLSESETSEGEEKHLSKKDDYKGLNNRAV